MKSIVYNDNNLKEEDIDKWIRRAKLLVVNSKNEILIVRTNDNYYFLGGHVENDESDYECLVREIKEEAGVDYDPKIDAPLVTIKYLSKDYPQLGFNTGYISNYYVVYDDLIPDFNNINLTEDENKHNFKLVYIPSDKIVDEVKSIFDVCERKNVLRDTILVLEECLKKI